MKQYTADKHAQYTLQIATPIVTAVLIGLVWYFLAGADSVTGGLHLTGKVGLHRRHAGVDQQQRCVILRDQGKAGQAQMALALEEGEEHFPKFVYAVRLCTHGFLTSIFSAKQKTPPPKFRGEATFTRGTTLIYPKMGILDAL